MCVCVCISVCVCVCVCLCVCLCERGGRLHGLDGVVGQGSGSFDRIFYLSGGIIGNLLRFAFLLCILNKVRVRVS